MVVLGMWLATIGYAVAYAGVRTLAGDSCSLVQAFSGTCGPKATSAGTGGRGPGLTQRRAAELHYARQVHWLSQVPIPT